MDTSIEEIYEVFGELVAVQGVTMKRQQAQLIEFQRELLQAQDRIKELEGTDDALGQPSPNGLEGREMPLAEGGGQAGPPELLRVAQVPDNPSDAG